MWKDLRVNAQQSLWIRNSRGWAKTPVHRFWTAARRRISVEPPKNGGVREQVQYIDEFHGRLESELVKMGVKADRARELAQSEKTAMYDQALTAHQRAREGRRR